MTPDPTPPSGRPGTPEAPRAGAWRRLRRWPVVGLLLLAAVSATAGWWWVRLQATALAALPSTLQCAVPASSADAPHPGMVWVPSGRFTFGDTVYPEEMPLRTVEVPGFWIDRTEVSNAEFAAFVQATGYLTVAERPVDPALFAALPPDMQQPGAVVFTPPLAVHSGNPTQWWRYVPGASWRHPSGPGSNIDGRGAFPVTLVTIDDARAYAAWKGRTLPTEPQWEWAAQGGQADARATPDPADPASANTTALRNRAEPPANANTWQGLFPVANAATDGFAGLAPVACYAPNGYGLYDMIGNAWELTADRWSPDHASAAPAGFDPAAGPRRLAAAGQHVIKGGSYLCAANYCMRYRRGARQPQDDDLGASHVGFRTILVAPGP